MSDSSSCICRVPSREWSDTLPHWGRLNAGLRGATAGLNFSYILPQWLDRGQPQKLSWSGSCVRQEASGVLSLNTPGMTPMARGQIHLNLCRRKVHRIGPHPGPIACWLGLEIRPWLHYLPTVAGMYPELDKAVESQPLKLTACLNHGIIRFCLNFCLFMHILLILFIWFSVPFSLPFFLFQLCFSASFFLISFSCIFSSFYFSSSS